MLAILSFNRWLVLAALVGYPVVSLAQNPRARVRLPGYSQIIVLDTLAARVEVPAPAAEVFTVTAAALEHELQIELATRDSANGVVGNLSLTKMRRLGKSPLSRYLSCGSGMTGPNADAYRIYLAVVALIDPLPNNRSRLGVAVAAGAQDVQGNSKLPIACGSTGALETQIRRVVAARFGMPAR